VTWRRRIAIIVLILVAAYLLLYLLSGPGDTEIATAISRKR
jgi:hypothetical protein